MKTLLLGSAAAAAFATIPAFAQTPAPVPVAPRAHSADHVQSRTEVAAHVQAMFAKLDTDRNGWLTKTEADAGREQVREKIIERRIERRADHTFEQLDSDRNGSISRAEFDAAHAKHADRRIEKHVRTHGDIGAARMHGRGMMGGRMFEMSDANKDGKVSLQEATAAALQHFDMADTNRDGQITREERGQMRKKIRTERRPA